MEYQYNIRCSAESILLLSGKVRDLCRDKGISVYNAQHIQIALVEAMNNISEHAYENNEDEKIDIYVEITGSRFVAELKDTGKVNVQGARPQHLVIDPDEPETLPEGGYGLNIIAQIMDDVSYTSNDGVNTIRMERNF